MPHMGKDEAYFPPPKDERLREDPKFRQLGVDLGFGVEVRLLLGLDVVMERGRLWPKPPVRTVLEGLRA